MTTKRGRPAGAKNTPADEQIRKDILKVYKRIGGVKWLEAWVKADPKNATEFVKQGLAKVLAQPMLRAIEQQQPEDAPALTDFDAARRVAFALSLALHNTGEPLTVEGEVLAEPQPVADWQPPSWVPPEHQQEAVEQPALPAPEPVSEDKPARRSLADLLGFEPPPTTEPSLYGAGVNQYRSGDADEQGAGRRDLIGDVRVVTRKETVSQKYRRMKGES